MCAMGKNKGNRRLKALFVTHDYGMYGASKSLQLLLKNNNQMDVTLAVPLKEILTLKKKEKIANKFGITVKDIKQFFLPWDNCDELRKTDFIHGNEKKIRNLLWKITQNIFYSEIERHNYDFIHLNSLVLNRMINRRYPFIIHIRDYLEDDPAIVVEHLKKAKGVIFIDDSVEMPFEGRTIPNKLTLYNPVDMSGVRKLINSNLDHGNEVIVSIIGRIEVAKGVDFIIKAFNRANCENMRLLIVGNGAPVSFVNYCKRLARSNKRIVFWGKEDNIDKIYALSDYVIRGEIDYRMGRSILEALYSDCDVILSSSDGKIAGRNVELAKFKNKVHCYSPRNIVSLKTLFKSLDKRKVVKGNFQSNVEKYVHAFNRYINRVVYPED